MGVFDCGSGLGNLALAIAAGWTERRSPGTRPIGKSPRALLTWSRKIQADALFRAATTEINR
jgi:hypothetical protein